MAGSRGDGYLAQFRRGIERCVHRRLQMTERDGWDGRPVCLGRQLLRRLGSPTDLHTHESKLSTCQANSWNGWKVDIRPWCFL